MIIAACEAALALVQAVVNQMYGTSLMDWINVRQRDPYCNALSCGLEQAVRVRVLVIGAQNDRFVRLAKPDK